MFVRFLQLDILYYKMATKNTLNICIINTLQKYSGKNGSI